MSVSHPLSNVDDWSLFMKYHHGYYLFAWLASAQTPLDHMISDPFMLNTFFLRLFSFSGTMEKENYVSEEASAEKLGEKMLCMRTQESAE